MPDPTDLSVVDVVLRHLADIGAGRCSITERMLAEEPDPSMQQILAGLLIVFEDLAYAEKLHATAEAEREALARDRERLLEELKRAVAARDQFVSVASHELRTPIATLALQVESLRRLGDREIIVGPMARGLEVIDRQVTRLRTLVDRMLDVSRINMGMFREHPTEVDLVEAVTDAVRHFDFETARRHVDVVVRAQGPVHGMWDATQVEQVVTNLVSNALKYGEGKPIEVAVRREGSNARLDVRDHGMGISADDQRRLFVPFARAVPARHYGGLGLGLWISAQIVSAIGGSISVRSAPAQGSTFTVLLPALP